MIVPEPKSTKQNDENMLPMINVVFLLLIFFMIAGVITSADGIDLTPVEAEQGIESELDDIQLLLGAGGQIAIGSSPATRDELRHWLAERDADAGMLQVKADAETPSSELFELMQLLNEAGVENIRLLAMAK